MGGADCPQWVLWPLALPPWKAQSSGHSQGLHGSSDLPSPVNITLSNRVNIFLLQGQLFSSPGSTFCADSYFGIRSTPVLPQQHGEKIPIILPKVQVAEYG